MVEKMHVVTGNFDGCTYLILSSEKPPKVISFKYSQTDKFILQMRKRRDSCEVPKKSIVPNIWTEWLENKIK